MADLMEPLREGHLEDAAALVSLRFKTERESNPSLPPRYENSSEILRFLREIVPKEEGVAVVRQGRLAGFMTAMTIPAFRGARAAWSPEWANGTLGGDNDGLYYAMYESMAPLWLAKGKACHLISVFSGDTFAAEALNWLGFGMVAVDAMRGLEPVKKGDLQVELSKAGSADAGLLMELNRQLGKYLGRSPVFLCVAPEEDLGEHSRWLSNDSNALVIGRLDGEIAGFMRLTPSNPTSAYLIRDPGTLSVCGAWVKDDLRGRGVGSALLAWCIKFARDSGYLRCSVDFEPENLKGRAFWLRHFGEFCRTYCRHIDRRLLPKDA